jgi:hypothetical protein
LNTPGAGVFKGNREDTAKTEARAREAERQAEAERLAAEAEDRRGEELADPRTRPLHLGARMNSRCVRKDCDNARAVGRLCLRREHPHRPLAG